MAIELKQKATTLWIVCAIGNTLYSSLHLLMHFSKAFKDGFRDVNSSSFWTFAVIYSFYVFPIIFLVLGNSKLAGRMANSIGITSLLFSAAAGIQYGIVFGASYLAYLTTTIILFPGIYAVIYTRKWIKLFGKGQVQVSGKSTAT